MSRTTHRGRGAAGPVGEAPNQEPVDWRARSQGLEEERDAFRDLLTNAKFALRGWRERAEKAEKALRAERSRFEALANVVDRHRETLDRGALGRTRERDDVDNQLYNGLYSLRRNRVAQQFAALGLPDEEGEELQEFSNETPSLGDGGYKAPSGRPVACGPSPDVDALCDAWAIGDSLQSSASRLAEFVVSRADNGEDVPYEVHMAAVEAIAQVGEWTEFRMASEPEAAGDPRAPASASTEPDDSPAAGQGGK